MSDKAYKILHLESESNSTKLIAHNVLSEKINADFVVVKNQDEFAAKLDKSCKYNLIIIEDFLEQFTAIDALALTHKACKHTPVIVVADSASGEKILKTLESGAAEYVLKNELIKLPLLIERIIKRKHMEQQLEKLALYEPITGLPNRRLLHDILERTIARAVRNKSKFIVMYFSLNHFKKIKEVLSPKSIEQLLVEAAARLYSGIRKSDFIAYLGADQFVGIFENTQTNVSAAVVAKQIIKDFYRPFHLEGEKCNCTLSIGIAKYPDTGNSAAHLLLRAEQALHRAQANGHNNFEFFTEGMDSDAKRLFALENHLYRAIKNEELYLVYQPLYKLQADTFCGFEVLVRWDNKQFGNILPNEFIPIAENTGLINELGYWVIESAFAQYKLWMDKCPAVFTANINISLNLSPIQLFNFDIVDMIDGALHKYNINPNRVILELAETAVMNSTERVKANLHKLNNAGIRIAIDDFGIGNSSLNYLRTLPVKLLKIDAGFIANLFIDGNGERLVKGIIMLGKAMNLEVVAEGVETAQQKEFLSKELCDIGQGYYFSKPMPLDELEKLLVQYEKFW